MSQLRQQVLSSFRQLHRLRARVFKNDSINLRESRDMMNSIYKQNSGLTDELKIKEELVNAHESYKAISALLRVEQKDETTNKICGFNEHTAWNDNYIEVGTAPEDPCLCFGGTEACGNCCRSTPKKDISDLQSKYEITR